MKDKHHARRENQDDQPRRGPRDRPDNPDLSKLIASTRKRLEWTQLELARRAGVSPKTVVRAEDHGKIRSDALIRIGAAMNQPIEDWLTMAGYQVSPSQIEDVLSSRDEAQPLAFPLVDPVQYFDRVNAHLDTHKSGIMISVISSPVAIDNEGVAESFGKLIENGLRVALVCPFPNADGAIAQYCSGLNTYYTRSYDWACDLAAKIEQLYGLAKASVPVFCPTVDQRATIIYPPIRLNDLRPAVIKYAEVRSESKIECKERHAVGVYVRRGDGRTDKWLDIYDGEDTFTERVKEAKDIWLSYLREIADVLLPSGELPHNAIENMLFWKRMR